MKQARGLTVLEAVIVVAIVAIVAALLAPVFAKAKQAALRRGSVAKLQGLYLALETYRNDYNGSNVVYDYYKLGLPLSKYFWEKQFDLPEDAWTSPCGSDPEITRDTLTNVGGWIFYRAGYADPRYIRMIEETGREHEYKYYLQQYRENSVMFGDPFCNPPGAKMRAPLIKKRTIAILLSGQIVNRERAGNAQKLQFYSDPPD